MTCSRCQTINPEGAVTCASCGAPLMMGAPMGPAGAPMMPPQGGYPPPGGMYPPGYGQPMMMMPQQPSTSGMAIAGLVCAFVCAPLGLIFSIIGLSQVKNSNGTKTGSGLAIAGIIISILALTFGILNAVVQSNH